MRSRACSLVLSLVTLALSISPFELRAEGVARAPVSTETSTRTFSGPAARVDLEAPTSTRTVERPILGALGLIALDSSLESRCVVAERHATLILEGEAWPSWCDLSASLAAYLEPDPRAPDPRRHERLLLETGFFSSVRCTHSADMLMCWMTPKPMIRTVDVEGRLPFVLLEEDIQRRIFLRPGVVVEDVGDLDDQARRLERFLERKGFYRSDVEVSLKRGPDGAQPNFGLELDTSVKAGFALELDGVEVLGEDALPKKKIEDVVRHYWIFSLLPRRFTPEQLEEDIEALTRMLGRMGWPEARVHAEPHLDFHAGKVRLELKIDAGPRLLLRFSGNHVLDDDALAALATFQKSGSIDPVEIDNTRRAIEEKYQRYGYYLVKVTAQVEDAAREGEAKARVVRFEVDEGPRATVERVVIRGNQILAEGAIRAGAELKTHGNRLFSRGRWIDARVLRDIRAIVRFYQSQGFEMATVEAVRTRLANDEIEVVFEIVEGPRRMVKSVEIFGLPPEVPKDLLDKRLRLLPGRPFVEASLALDRREILTALAAHGYTQAEVSRKLKVPYKTEPGEAELEYHVEPNDQAVFGGFFLRGAFRTRPGVIENELKLEPGDPLDLLTLSDAKQRLRSLGVFGSVDLKPLGQTEARPSTWLLVDLTEVGKPALDFVFSFSTRDLLRLGVDYRDGNFLGRAIRLNLSARLSNASQLVIRQSIGRRDHVQATLDAPRPLGLPFDADYSLFYDFEDQTKSVRTDAGDFVSRGFTRRRVGAGAAVSRVFLERGYCRRCPEVLGRLGYELASTEGVDYGGVPSPELANTPNTTVARIVPTLLGRTLDSLLDPKTGYSATVRFELGHSALAGPFEGAASFVRLLSSVDFYSTLGEPFREELSESISLGGPFVVAFGSSFGLGRPIASSTELPVSETFDYGGDLSVRGISERASLSSVKGATHLWTATLELRQYFLDTSFGTFQAALLSDIGMVSRLSGALVDDPTISVGGALRYVTPVGPVSVAYAYPVRRARGIVDRGRLHISFGYSF